MLINLGRFHNIISKQLLFQHKKGFVKKKIMFECGATTSIQHTFTQTKTTKSGPVVQSAYKLCWPLRTDLRFFYVSILEARFWTKSYDKFEISSKSSAQENKRVLKSVSTE